MSICFSENLHLAKIFRDYCACCVSALIVHCVALIQATCSDANAMEEIIHEDFVFDKLVGFVNISYKKRINQFHLLFDVLIFIR